MSNKIGRLFSNFVVLLCLVLLQVPKCFGLVQMFCARPKIYLHILAVTNILCQTKRWFAFSKIGFCGGKKVFEEALNAIKFLDCLKTFGPAQNILGPVKGQGIRAYCPNIYTVPVDHVEEAFYDGGATFHEIFQNSPQAHKQWYLQPWK